MGDVCCLSLAETFKFRQSFEELSTSDDFWNYVIIVIVFHQIHYSYNIWVRLWSKDRELILKQLNINLLFFNLFLLHYFYCKFFTRCFVRAITDKAESSLTQDFSKRVSRRNIFHEFELFVVVYRRHLVALQTGVIQRNLLEGFSDLAHVWYAVRWITQIPLLTGEVLDLLRHVSGSFRVIFGLIQTLSKFVLHGLDFWPLARWSGNFDVWMLFDILDNTDRRLRCLHTSPAMNIVGRWRVQLLIVVEQFRVIPFDRFVTCIEAIALFKPICVWVKASTIHRRIIAHLL